MTIKALYQAKHAGRNRLAVAGMEERHLAANGRMRPLDG